MSNIINETFKKHLQLLKSRLNKSDCGVRVTIGEGDKGYRSPTPANDRLTVAVGKFLDIVFAADPRMYDIKNRDKVFNLVKSFLTSTKYGQHVDVSDISVKSYVNGAMAGNSRWKASSTSAFADKEETSDLQHPYVSGTTNLGVDSVEDDDPEIERQSWEKSSAGRLGYSRDEDDFSNRPKSPFGFK